MYLISPTEAQSTLSSSSALGPRDGRLGLTGLGGEQVGHLSEGAVGTLDVGDEGVELRHEVLHLALLPEDLLVQQGVLGLGGLEARVELGLVGDEGGGEVRGEDAVGGEEVWWCGIRNGIVRFGASLRGVGDEGLELVELRDDLSGYDDVIELLLALLPQLADHLALHLAQHPLGPARDGRVAGGEVLPRQLAEGVLQRLAVEGSEARRARARGDVLVCCCWRGRGRGRRLVVAAGLRLRGGRGRRGHFCVWLLGAHGGSGGIWC